MKRLYEAFGAELWAKRDNYTDLSTGGHHMPVEMERAVKIMRTRGRKVYVIPGGGLNPTGALGYVNRAFVLLAQANDASMVIDRVVYAAGSSGIQAWLVTGFSAMDSGVPVQGLGTCAPKPKQAQLVYNLACKTAERLGCHRLCPKRRIQRRTHRLPSLRRSRCFGRI